MPRPRSPPRRSRLARGRGRCSAGSSSRSSASRRSSWCSSPSRRARSSAPCSKASWTPSWTPCKNRSAAARPLDRRGPQRRADPRGAAAAAGHPPRDPDAARAADRRRHRQRRRGRRARRRRRSTQLADGLRGEGPLVVTIDDVGTYRVEAYQTGPSVVVVGRLARRGRGDARADAHDDRAAHRSAGSSCSRRPPRGRSAPASHRCARSPTPPSGSRSCRSTRARCRSPSACPRTRGRSAHRGRTRRRGAEHAARPRRRVPRRPPAQRGADAALRRRREPRAAHAARLDPRLLRALAARARRRATTR